METNANKPINVIEYNKHYAFTGLTKREYFAAMALQGFLACNAHDSIEDDVKYAVKSADALIEELNKTKQDEKK